MRSNKTIILILALCIIGLLITSCGKNPSQQLNGEWRVLYFKNERGIDEMEGIKSMGGMMNVTFTENERITYLEMWGISKEFCEEITFKDGLVYSDTGRAIAWKLNKTGNLLALTDSENVTMLLARSSLDEEAVSNEPDVDYPPVPNA